MYDQGVVKIQKMGKQRYFTSTMSMDLKGGEVQKVHFLGPEGPHPAIEYCLVQLTYSLM